MKAAGSFLKKAVETGKYIMTVIAADNVAVYAAQASFFVIISAVPFISLLISVFSFFVPADISYLYDGFPTVSDKIMSLMGPVLHELKATTDIPLLSISAVIALWTSSKGIGAMCRGLETVYKAKISTGFVKLKFRSLLNTLFFIVLIVALVVVLLFGNFIAELVKIPLFTNLVMKLRFPVALLFMCAVFCITYSSIAKREGCIPKNFSVHLPGAVFSSLGCVLFSFGYSLYITYFPDAGYIYGSLAAICLIMLWIYFCTIIILLGAEINKLIYNYRLDMSL